MLWIILYQFQMCAQSFISFILLQQALLFFTTAEVIAFLAEVGGCRSVTFRYNPSISICYLQFPLGLSLSPPQKKEKKKPPQLQSVLHSFKNFYMPYIHFHWYGSLCKTWSLSSLVKILVSILRFASTFTDTDHARLLISYRLSKLSVLYY